MESPVIETPKRHGAGSFEEPSARKSLAVWTAANRPARAPGRPCSVPSKNRSLRALRAAQEKVCRCLSEGGESFALIESLRVSVHPVDL